MPFDPALAARVASTLLSLGVRGTREKNVFGGRGFLVGKSTFVIAWDDGILVKTPTGEYATALAEPDVTPFTPDGGRPMGTWVVVPAERVADDPELAEWVARGLRAVR
ncbi:MAG: TfoX/Sxy family protein [Gemmatirosa sp.]